MTKYREFWKAFSDEAPRREVIDRILRELPMKMAQAISDYLAAPSGSIGLFRCVVDNNGHRRWVLCGVTDCLQTDRDGIHQFSVGISTGGPINSDYRIIYIQFNVEEFDEKSVALRINNLAGVISIADAHDSASYADAAKIATELLINDLKNPKPLRGSRSPIGFGHV